MSASAADAARSHGTRPVLHVIDSLDCGGAQELLVLLARVTPQDRYPTSVAVIQPFIGMLDRLRAEGVDVHCLNRPRPSIVHPLRFFGYVAGVVGDLRRICRSKGICILHCHLSDAEFTGILAGKLSGVRRILDTVHTPSVLPTRRACDPRTLLRVLLTRGLLNMADWVIAVSRETGQALEKLGVSKRRIKVVENGIDVLAYGAPPKDALRQELGLPSATRVLATVARLTEQKGHTYLIEAMPEIVRRFPDAHLLLLGEGELREPLAAKACQLGVDAHISFLGVRPDVADVLALADVFVLPSLWEGTSLALLEAMASARPIVATDIDGNRPVLRHERDCLLAPPGQPQPLAEAVCRLLADRELATRLGCQARAEALAQFDIRTMFSTYESLWNASPGAQGAKP